MTISQLFLISFIIFIFFLILTSIMASICRRVWNKRRYEKLDLLRELLRPALRDSIATGSIDAFTRDTKIPAGSLKWEALEQILLEMCEGAEQKTEALKLFQAFGYVQYYQKQLSGRSSSIRFSATADKLGKIGDPSAIPFLVQLLQHKESEVVTVAFRSLCRIGSTEALSGVLTALPALLKGGKVTAKAIQTSLLLFGPWAGEPFLKYAAHKDDPEVLSVMIETLIAYPISPEMFQFALSRLSHPNAEVRAKALKLLARHDMRQASFPYNPQIFQPLLKDPVWYVRLQLARTIETLRCDQYIEMLKKLVLDRQWQVRDAATASLINTGEESIDAFLELLETEDRFAKEGISEAVQRTGYKTRLIEWLGGVDLQQKFKALRMMTMMDRAGFPTPMREAIEAGCIGPELSKELAEVPQTGGAV